MLSAGVVAMEALEIHRDEHVIVKIRRSYIQYREWGW
jgi:hypothetical protein